MHAGQSNKSPLSSYADLFFEGTTFLCASMDRMGPIETVTEQPCLAKEDRFLPEYKPV
jgi:hypothetical protein